MSQLPKVAVIGGGVAGIVSAYLLQRRYEVELFEAGPWLGGHTHTVVLNEGVDAGTAIDTGFIVFNGETYPLFQRFLAELGVARQLSDMSFGYYCEGTGWAYGGHDLDTFFARRRHLFHPDFLRFTLDVARFNLVSTHKLRKGTIQGSLRQYLRGYSRVFLKHYIKPLGAAIWSAPLDDILDFPALTYIRFFANHGLFRVVQRPDWFTVAGGSFRYVQAFQRGFEGKVHLATPVEQVTRPEQGLAVVRVAGESREFSAVVLATHADQALKLLGDATPGEVAALGPWRYLSNRAVLHHDQRVLPPLKKVEASWNYRRPRVVGQFPTLSYDMNRLQSLTTQHRYFVTLNPQEDLDADKVVGEWSYRHPQFDQAAVASQPLLSRLQGERQTAFCGSYHRYGFHEDAVMAAVSAARSLGVEW